MSITRVIWRTVILTTLIAANGCVFLDPEQGDLPRPESKVLRSVKHPGFSKNLSIYEVNIRQFTPGGTFAEFEEHLPRLKELGVGILWFMPIHPIGELNRKGSLGSYYSVKDYMAVNPEFGTIEEFKSLVNKIHEMGMYVLIDWVANHSAWDNPLTLEHPEFYTVDSSGNFMPPVDDWADVIDINFDNPELRRYMIDALKFWVEETDIDGYRCDVAGMVPIEFWNAVRPELDAIKPVFMLAEWETPELHEKAFDMTYSWKMLRIVNGLAKGEKKVSEIDDYLREMLEDYPDDAIRMHFITNHDENSWNGSEFERLGEAVKALAVLTYTLDGMPLLYSGQEAGLSKRISFFDKDTIEWKESEFTEFYKTLNDLKRNNMALWHTADSGDFTKVSTTADSSIYSFVRGKNDSSVFVVLNLSGKEAVFTFEGDAHLGEYTDLFNGMQSSFTANTELKLGAWNYKVFVRE